ncbi:hypothetical protein [Tolypothrix sp. VBCCA 56010]|uniref:hypothetical protein n=1 Tax=Tolypothrix sp. VBCCA 56010 TaxID=3137731 RepID=UPI003D7CD16D
MFELVENHHSGEPLIPWQEVERRAIEDLDNLEEQYRLSYPWAREKYARTYQSVLPSSVTRAIVLPCVLSDRIVKRCQKYFGSLFG